ncbi:MAG: hypothetical protein ACI3W5_03515, partial [Faecousia sp.]
IGSDRSAPWDDELQRLYDLGFETVFPRTPGHNVRGKELSAEEYVEYATFTGQERYRLLGEVTQSKYYLESSDADKEDIIGQLYSYVSGEGVRKVLPDEEISTWIEKGMKMEAYGISFAEFLRMKNTALNENGNFTKTSCVEYIQKNFPMSQWKAIYNIMKNENWKEAF